MRKQGGGKETVKYDVEISVWIKLLPRSHSVTYHCSASKIFFMGSRSVNKGYRLVISAQLGVISRYFYG